MHPVSPFHNFGRRTSRANAGRGIMEKKVLNDTIAYGKSLAQKRKRNVDWTVRAIRDAVSSTYLEPINSASWTSSPRTWTTCFVSSTAGG